MQYNIVVAIRGAAKNGYNHWQKSKKGLLSATYNSLPPKKWKRPMLFIPAIGSVSWAF